MSLYTTIHWTMKTINLVVLLRRHAREPQPSLFIVYYMCHSLVAKAIVGAPMSGIKQGGHIVHIVDE